MRPIQHSTHWLGLALACGFITCPVSSPSAPIPLDQLGAVATEQTQGDSLSITPVENGAELRCAFQRLEGQATTEGLWLVSTTEGPKRDRFRLVACAIGREGEIISSVAADVSPLHFSSGVVGADSHRLLRPHRALPRKGTVRVDGQLVRFIRPGVIEEYSVSVDGVRQDFLIMQRPAGTGDLCVELSLSGAQAELIAMGGGTATGAKLTLEGSGRTLAYSWLRATDATGKELTARIEVLAADRLAVRVDDADAVYPVRIDPTFSDADWVGLNALHGASGPVYAIAVDSSGNVYCAGNFEAIGTTPARNIAKWDGSSWSALGSGLDDRAGALAVSGTTLYVGGFFRTAGGVPANYIAKWDGSSWSALGSGVYRYVYALAVSGTDLYAGGYFTTAGGLSANHIAKWNGSTWSALGSGVDSVVTAIVADTNGHLYVGGHFTTAGGVTANRIAAWDGSAWSALGLGLDQSVYALAVNGTDVYAGGYFTTAGGLPANNIAQWNGSTWSALGSGVNGSVGDLAVIGNDLYVEGSFSAAGGVSVNGFARWNGSTWTAVGVGGGGPLAASGTDLYTWGTLAGGSPLSSLIKWDGSAWSTVGSRIQKCGRITSIAVSGTDLYAAGDWFRTTSGFCTNCIVRWDGSTWSLLGEVRGVEVLGYSFPQSLTLAANGTDVYLGGEFSSVDGVPATGIAKWDGIAWSAVGSGLGNGMPHYLPYATALTVIGGDVYVAGHFGTAGGVPANNIAKWNGSTWTALGSGIGLFEDPYHAIDSLAVIGTDLYAGGTFKTDNGAPANYIAKWNGSSWSALGSGVDQSVNALAASGTDLYVGGRFTAAGGVEASRIAKWDGSSWSALGLGMNGPVVYALAAIGPDLYVGGYFTAAGGVEASRIAKWDGDEWSALGSGIDGKFSSSPGPGVNELAVDAEGRLYVSGDFLIAGGTVSPNIARADLVGLDLAWSAIASPQQADVAFPVSVTAKSYAGTILTNFTDTVNISGYALGLSTTNASIGTGTAAWAYPLNALYHDARTQVIYQTNEVGRACTINSLALEVTTAPGQTLTNWTIRMKHTSLAEYPASPEWEGSGWTVVYQGDEPAGTTGWRTFELSTPFEYNGSDNLLVDFSFNNDSYTSEGQCQSTVMGSYRSITFASDSKDGDPLTWFSTNPIPVRSYNAPNVMLGATYPGLLPVSLSPSVTTPFVNGVWTGEVTVHEAASNVVLRADDGLGHEGQSNPFDVHAAPRTLALVMHDNPFSFTNGCYGFTVQGSAGQVVVVEASIDLLNWQPIHTNLMGDMGECLFYDLHTGQFPRRYYRAKLHEGELAPPAMLESGAGVVGAQFRVAVGAVGGQDVIVEASTNLVDWTPILTNTAGIGPLYFYDPDMTNFTQRLYRAVTP